VRTITLENHEALVLFEFLSREITDNNGRNLLGSLDHSSEFWALSAVLGRLESLLEEPFRADYLDLLEAARARIIERRDPDGDYVIGSPG
jgi:hypothetical protein